MSLSPIEKGTVEFAQLFFFYLPPFPFHWNHNYSQLECRSRLFMIPWLIALLNIFLDFLACSWLVVLHCRGMFSNVKFTNQDSFSQACCVPILYTISLLSCTVFRHGNSSLIGFNKILALCKRAELHYSKYFQKMNYLKERENRESLFLIVLVSQLPLTPWIMIVTCLAFNLESYYFLLEEYILTQPVWRRSVRENYFALLCRICFLLHVSSESCRIVGIAGSNLLIFLTRIRRFLLIVSKEKQRSKFYQTYREFFLAYGCLQDCFNACLKLVYQLLFVCSIQILWFACKGYGKVQFGIYLLICMTGVCVLSINVVVLPMLFRTGVLCKKVLRLQKRLGANSYRLNKTRKSKLEMLQLNSLTYIKINCGSVFECNEDSMVVFFTQLNLRWFDAMLLLHM